MKYRLTIDVEITNKETLIELARLIYQKKPAHDEHDSIIPPERFIDCIENAIIELYSQFDDEENPLHRYMEPVGYSCGPIKRHERVN